MKKLKNANKIAAVDKESHQHRYDVNGRLGNAGFITREDHAKKACTRQTECSVLHFFIK
jgi:hypothetical protein